MNSDDYLSDSESIQEAIRQSLAECNPPRGEESDQDSSVIMDLTAEERSFINNDNKSNSLDDEVFAFFVEAGLENPEELNMLGIDIETVRAQKELEERIARDSRMNRELAERLQNEQSTETESFVSQTSLKREIDSILENDKKKMRFANSIDLEDENTFLVDLTNDEEDEEEFSVAEPMHDYLSNVPWAQYDPNATSSARRKQKMAARRDLEGLERLRSFDYRVAESSGSSSSSSRYYGRQLPSAVQGHMSLASQISRHPYTPAMRMSDEETERELRELLENIADDELPSPEDRTGTPDQMSINLLEHQKIGLQWMLKAENSTNKGGILADDMGLGKTIQALAVICSHPREDPTHVNLADLHDSRRIASGELKIKATLIVCPVSLIDQWRREIESKTKPKLKVYVYHGTRVRNPYKLAHYDVIITSYAVAASDFTDSYKGPLSQVKLHRVILDEAHTIKNKGTKAARGCCQLETTFRWCMTATPIQNNVNELYSLIKFLRIRPFCDWSEFRDAISKPMKGPNPEKAIKVAHVLMKAITLRRSKKALIDGKPILNLPERNVQMTHIEFSPDERIHYDFVNDQAQAKFTKYMKANTVMKNYSSVLVLLLRLRQACLHPSLTTEEGEPVEKNLDAARQMSPEVVQRLLSDSATINQIECPICMDIAQNAQIMHCGHILCKECFDNYWNNADGNMKRCPQCRGSIDRQKLVDIETFLKVHAPELVEEPVKKEEETLGEILTSAKIEKMLDILETSARESNNDKTIVFSQFTAMLDLIEKPLKNSGIKYLRYDGSMDIKHRADTVNTFFNDPTATVLLVSTKCGSLGLNLTCANRVILLDVWWNPAIENQAIDRVHRIGQTKPVKVHRIFIKDTVEDRILQLQDKKQSIADGVLGEGTSTSVGRLSLNELIYLFRGE